MPGPSFSQSADPALYWLADAGLPQSYAIGLLLHSPSPTPPPTIDLGQSWTTYPGLYVMVGVQPVAGGEAAFIAALDQLKATLGPALRFVWLSDAMVPPAQWQPHTILVDQEAGAASGTIAAPAQLRFGSYILGLAAGQTIAPTADGFALTDGGSWAFSLRTPTSIWTLSAPSGPEPVTVLSFAGTSAGCVLLNLELPQDHGGSGVDDYTRLDAGLRFAIDDRSDPEQGLLLSLDYPLFAGVPADGVSFVGSFDPALPLVATRTRLAYAAGAPAHGSNYRSQLGYAVTLTPEGQPGDPLPAGLAFHRRPGSLHALPEDDPLYLGPIGSFALAVAGTTATAGSPADPAARLGCGLAGTEYFGLSAASGALLSFSPGGKAYAQLLGAPPPPVGSPPEPALTDVATSPWASVQPSASQQAWYYAQPIDAALYRIRDASSQADLVPYLVFLEIAAGGITASTGGDGTSYPLVPYAGIVAGQLGRYRELEAQVLSPARRAALAPAALAAETTGDSVAAVTPQGLLARLSADLQSWSALSLVAAPAQANTPPALAFNNLSNALSQAFQTNQLFMVAANGQLLSESADLNYWLTDVALDDLAALTGPTRPPDTVLQKLRAGARQPQIGKTAMTTLLQRVLAPAEQQYIPTIVQYAAYFEITIGSWRFRLSPTLWQTATAAPTIMIFKFATSDLRSLVQDTAAWTWPPVGQIGGDIVRTRDTILTIIDQAAAQVAAAGDQPHPLDFFVNTICNDPLWTGVLFLNASVPFGSMPEELRGLAAGIDASQFRAHHVGLSVTPVRVDTDARTLALGASAFFGLIDYESPEDIAHSFADFDFKVLQLRVLFRNSAVADFAGRIELFVNRLFGDSVSLVGSAHYNNLILLGSYQRQQGVGQYVFATGGASLFSCQGAVLESVEVARAQFNTTAASPTGDDTVHARFLIWGRLRFRQLEGFDLFSFGPTVNRQGAPVDDGYLLFSGLAVTMQFAPANPDARSFGFDIDNVAFDLSASIARTTSFFARFPLKLSGLVRGEPGQTPTDRGYEPVETPLNQPMLADGWYALAFTVDLGTLGALAADAGLLVTLLAAWDSTPGTAAVNVGLRLPGAQSLKSLPAIQGVLQVGFQSIQINADGARAWPPNPAYVLRFRRFALRLLGWRFPPGQTDVYLFGDPEAGPQQSGALGWYAAYLKQKDV